MRTACAIVIVLGVAGLFGTTSARALSRAGADRAALKALRGMPYSPAILFRAPDPLSAGTRITLADVGRQGARRLRERGWLYWADLAPNKYFQHQGALVVIGQRTGRVLVEEATVTWPLIHDRPPPFLRTTAAYDSRSYRVLTRGSRAQTAVATIRASDPPAHVAAGSGARCMIVAGPPAASLNTPLRTLFWSGHLNDANQMIAAGQRLGIPVQTVANLSQLQDALSSATAGGCTDIMIFMTGEGSPAPRFAIPGALRGLFGGRKAVFGDPDPNIELNPNGTKIYAKDLRDTLTKIYDDAPSNNKPSFSLVLQECFGGRFFPELGTAPGVKLIVASSSPGTEARRNLVGGASPFVNEMTDGIIEAFGPGGVSSWPADLIKAFNAIKPYGDDPQLDVRGKIISAPTNSMPVPKCKPNEQGGIDLLLKGDYFGSEWGAGTVTARNSASPAVVEQASVGFDSVSAGHFGPWPCGTKTKLTATAPQGYHFDRWTSTDGLCSLGGATCTVPITDRLYDITAYFAPTVYQVTINGGKPPKDGKIQSGGGNGYLYPGIDCGSQPNGPTTNTETECKSGAQAMRDDQDITQLTVTADDPGPGSKKYAITGLSGCDSTVVISSFNGQIYSEQCFLDVTSDKTVTATFAAVGPAG